MKLDVLSPAGANKRNFEAGDSSDDYNHRTSSSVAGLTIIATAAIHLCELVSFACRCLWIVLEDPKPIQHKQLSTHPAMQARGRLHQNHLLLPLLVVLAHPLCSFPQTSFLLLAHHSSLGNNREKRANHTTPKSHLPLHSYRDVV